jgi:hypothetical protein
VLIGHLTLEQEHEIVLDTRRWIEERAEPGTAYKLYVDNWGDWQNPWTKDEQPA